MGGLFTADSVPRAPSWARLVDPSYSLDRWRTNGTKPAPDPLWAGDWRLSGDNATWVEGSQVGRPEPF